MRKIKVLLVDDSPLFLAFLQSRLSGDGRFEIVGTAANPYEARDKILSLRPDVLTLDIEMPRMDGVKFIQRLMPQYPIPCIVVSSFTAKADEAVAAGARCFIPKPDANSAESIDGFTARLKAELAAAAAGNGQSANAVEVIALGASTGGTEALLSVLSGLRKGLPPIVIVQHMPAGFTRMYAERLNRLTELSVFEASDGLRLERSMCVIAAGGQQMRLRRDFKGLYVTSAPDKKVSGHCPSVDVLFESVADTVGENCLAVIMTGMGADGAKGMLRLKEAGAYTIGQNKESCVVYGMPMEARKLGAVCEELPLDNIAGRLLELYGG